MTYRALELRYVAEIDRVLELLIRLMACITSPIGEGSEIHRMDERPRLHVCRRRSVRIINGRVANVAVVRDDLAGVAEMLAIVAPETTR